VLLYHAGLGLVPGGFVGVDVFFVISGFLITGQLLKEVHRDGRVSLLAFYARRAKRLLPATAVVLVATVAMVVAFVPRIRWSGIGSDVVSAALYVVNWRFATQSVDYLAEDVPPSPVQHFWSLAVEEQFYLVWPLLLLVLTWWAHRIGRRGRPRTRLLWTGLALVGLPSFLWSITYSAAEPPAAFFVTTTRMWELAVGAGVAIGAASWQRLPPPVAVVVGWAGLAAVVVAGLRFSEQLVWPGYAAVLPVLGTAAVIAAGPAAGPTGPVALLAARPLQWVGALSYSLYLWHWPLLVVATAALGRLSVPLGLLVAALSVGPAWLSYRYLETPFRFSRSVSASPRLALSLGANATLVGVVAGLVLVLAVPTAAPAPTGPAAGAQSLPADPDDAAAPGRGAPVDRVDTITPDPLHAPEDVPDLYARGCQLEADEVEPVTCGYGPADAATTIALVGDSKAAQWAPAFADIATQRHWRVTVTAKSACAFSDARPGIDGRPYEQCEEWNGRVLDELLDDPPDVLVTSQGSRAALSGDTGATSVSSMVAGLRSRWATLVGAGTRVVVLQDSPQPGANVYECVSEHRDQLTACVFRRDEGVARSAAPTLAAAAQSAEVGLVDLTDRICPTELCAPVIGNVLVYRQGSHLTKTYVQTLGPALDAALTEAVAG
jgi:peptidoglycan/LPS O-acetylase OafA/YrhL